MREKLAALEAGGIVSGADRSFVGSGATSGSASSHHLLPSLPNNGVSQSHHHLHSLSSSSTAAGVTGGGGGGGGGPDRSPSRDSAICTDAPNTRGSAGAGGSSGAGASSCWGVAGESTAVAVETVAALQPGVAVVVEKGLFFAPPSPSSSTSKRSATPPSESGAEGENGAGGGAATDAAPVAGAAGSSTAPLVQGDRIVSVDGVLVIPENMDDLANVSATFFFQFSLLWANAISDRPVDSVFVTFALFMIVVAVVFIDKWHRQL